MHTWMVGNAPVGHLELQYETPKQNPDSEGISQLGEKIFFMKGRIMAGQADLKSSVLGAKDFKWLAKEEVQKLVSANYWPRIRGMLPER